MCESPERLLRRIRLGEDGATGCREVAFSGGKIAEPDRNALAAFAEGDSRPGFADALPDALRRVLCAVRKLLI